MKYAICLRVNSHGEASPQLDDGEASDGDESRLSSQRAVHEANKALSRSSRLIASELYWGANSGWVIIVPAVIATSNFYRTQSWKEAYERTKACSPNFLTNCLTLSFRKELQSFLIFSSVKEAYAGSIQQVYLNPWKEWEERVRETWEGKRSLWRRENEEGNFLKTQLPRELPNSQKWRQRLVTQRRTLTVALVTQRRNLPASWRHGQAHNPSQSYTARCL